MDRTFQPRIDSALNKGLQFLFRRQKPNGEFCNYISSDEEMENDMQEDPSPFMTQHIAASLIELNDELANGMVQRALDFLRKERCPGGLWRFWNKSHPGSTYIPNDTDDTACINHLMQRMGFSTGVAAAVLAGNRNWDRLFYTWILPRPAHLLRPSTWLPLLAAVALPHRTFLFFRMGGIKPAPEHVDVVVNANAVLFLGESEETSASIAWIRKVIIDGMEAESDRFYQSPYPLFYAVMRCSRQGIGSFDDLKPLILERIRAFLSQPASGSKEVMHRALALNVLLAWNPGWDSLPFWIDEIVQAQSADGSWPVSVLYYNGWGEKQHHLHWGSQELVTAFCIEALNRFKELIGNKSSLLR